MVIFEVFKLCFDLKMSYIVTKYETKQNKILCLYTYTHATKTKVMDKCHLILCPSLTKGTLSNRHLETRSRIG